MPHPFAAVAAPFPPLELPGGRKLDAPHPEWAEHHVKWRWLLDSYEGGDAYRYGVYGTDASGTKPRRNLVRHKRERADYDAATGDVLVDDDYLIRLERTPVPGFVQEAVDKHLGKVYNQEVKRVGPEKLAAWWTDVDGCGSSADEWWGQVVAPLLLTLGQVDLIFERPAVPDGETPTTRADEIRLGLDSCVASYILPENMLWWRLDRRGRYVECLVREVGKGDDGGDAYVYWDATRWVRYGSNGKRLDGARGGNDDHGYGRVPIVRVGDSLRRPRCENVWMPRYEGVAEFQREYYNRDSELILSDTNQAFPLIQGPAQFCEQGSAIPVGPGTLLPKPVVSDGAGGSIQQDWTVVDLPKGGADSIRENKRDIRDAVDRLACLTKPAGSQGGDVTGQSGISKRLDQSDGNELLGEVAAVLERGETIAAEFATVVLTGKPPEPGSFKIVYPRRFDLFSLDEYLGFVERFEGVLATVGTLPQTESRMLREAVRKGLPGLDDDDYAAMDAEIAAHLAARAEVAREEADAYLESRRAATNQADPNQADPDQTTEGDE